MSIFRPSTEVQWTRTIAESGDNHKWCAHRHSSWYSTVNTYTWFNNRAHQCTYTCHYKPCPLHHKYQPYSFWFFPCTLQNIGRPGYRNLRSVQRRLDMTYCRTDAISYDIGMQFRVILGCGHLSDWSTASTGNEERTVLSHLCSCR